MIIETIATWQDLVYKALVECNKFKHNREYVDRLKIELSEIDKQGANNYWLRLYNSGQKFIENKNGLIFPYLLGITSIDPIECDIQHKEYFDPEFPDIDVDLLPSSRDLIKKYAEEKYGRDHVCNIGLWLTYKAKLALQDAATVLGHNRHEMIAICKNLPEEFDDMPYQQAYDEFQDFRKLADEKPELVELAYKMIGKIKSQGKHAGGLVISDVPIRDYIPLTYIGPDNNKQWTTAWTEGMAATQLSKFGFVKFDLLGLLNISYIYNCKRLIKDNYGDVIDFDDIDPLDNRIGWVIKGDSSKVKILLNDPIVLQKADEVKMESIFQFDTDFAKSIVEKGGVRSFTDLLIYTSLGRPGPLPMIDVYIKNRDDKSNSWEKELHPKMREILAETKGILCFQEQLLRIWVEVCGFTMPEAEAAQKAVKKKKIEILNEIKPRVINGASTLLGIEAAEELWERMVSFGRYCFNKSHAVAYMIIAYRCLWLKTYYPEEWWAAVLSECPANRTIQYMGAARSEGIKFGNMSINSLGINFSVDGKRITPGVTSIKGIGSSAADILVAESKKEKFKDLDDYVTRFGRNKTATERLIKLGAFNSMYSNRYALWMWYIYKYDTTIEAKKIRKHINYCYSWPIDAINEERKRQEMEYKRLYPKRNKMPAKILNWVPTTPYKINKEYDDKIEISDDDYKLCSKIVLDFDLVVKLFPKDFSLIDILKFEKEYLGYYWSSPLDVFEYNKGNTIEAAKRHGIIDCIIEEIKVKQGSRGDFKTVSVTDGINITKINIWTDDLFNNGDEVISVGSGVRMAVNWQEKWRSFSLKRDSIVMPLPIKNSVGED